MQQKKERNKTNERVRELFAVTRQSCKQIDIKIPYFLRKTFGLFSGKLFNMKCAFRPNYAMFKSLCYDFQPQSIAPVLVHLLQSILYGAAHVTRQIWGRIRLFSPCRCLQQPLLCAR